MSKYLKDLMTDELKRRWESVSDALLVNVVGMEVNTNVTLRQSLREKGIELMVVKNSLAQRATEGTVLGPAFEGMNGALAVVWGSDDIVSLAKEVIAISADEQFAPFETRGGVMDGKQLSAEDVEQISKWPNRPEQLSLLVGQILGPAATLSAQLVGPAAKLASQVKQKGEDETS